MNMYKSARRFSVLKRILEDGVLLSPKKVSGLSTIRSFTGEKKAEKETKGPLPFRDLLKLRRWQAGKSLLIEIENQYKVEDLYDYLRDIGKIYSMHHYTNQENSHYVLVEMHEEEGYLAVLKDAQPAENLVGGSPCSLLWFKPDKKQAIKQNQNRKLHNVFLNAPVQATKKDLKFDYFDITNLGQRMAELHQKSRIDDLGLRLRFFTCKQIEDAIKCINSSLIVLPFGSSVNGFGNMGGDLDMVGIPKLSQDKSSSRLVFHGKKFESERSREQIHLFLINDIMKHILPGCVNLSTIPNAFVPIIKYRQKQTCLECDLSLYRTDSVKMSELLYFLAHVDPRVRPLVCYVRHWAKNMNLTQEAPGAYITNFQLLLLVIFFFQQQITNEVSFLPPLEGLISEKFPMMTSEDFYKLRHKYYHNSLLNPKSLEELLLEFFRFYSEFDFNVYGVSLRTGKMERKSMNYNKTLHIENPLSPELNVSKNVTPGEMTKVQECCAQAFAALNKNFRRNETDVLSYMNIKELVELDYKKDETVAAENVREMKRDGNRRLMSENLREILKNDSFVDLKENESVRMDEAEEVKNLDEEKLSGNRESHQEMKELEKEEVDKSVKRQSVLKLNFKELINEN